MKKEKEKQPTKISKRIRKGDYVWIELESINQEITSNELHAIFLGLALTVISCLFLGTIGITLITLTVGYAVFGKPFLKSMPHYEEEYKKTIATRTIKHEPWWYLGGVLIGSICYLI